YSKTGQCVIGSFFASDNTCPNCQIGYQSSCQHAEFVGGAQASLLRVPLADGTLVATPGVPSEDLIPSLLSLSDVMGTAWFAADAASVKPGSTVAVVGDGAVGLLGVLSAKQMGAERIIAMSRHQSRQKLASEFGATDVVTERGDDGVDRIKELTNGVGADAAWGRARWPRAVLLPCPPPRWPRPSAPLPARADRPGVERKDKPRQGL